MNAEELRARSTWYVAVACSLAILLAWWLAR